VKANVWLSASCWGYVTQLALTKSSYRRRREQGGSHTLRGPGPSDRDSQTRAEAQCMRSAYVGSPSWLKISLSSPTSYTSAFCARLGRAIRGSPRRSGPAGQTKARPYNVRAWGGAFDSGGGGRIIECTAAACQLGLKRSSPCTHPFSFWRYLQCTPADLGSIGIRLPTQRSKGFITLTDLI
jgi:hypothetical protein